MGDRVFFYLSGPEAGIYAVGRVVSPVYAAPEEDEFGHWKVDVEYDAVVEPPLLRAGLTDPASEPVLAAWPPFRGLQGTNFPVPKAVAARLEQLLAGWLRPIRKQPGQGFDETAHAIDTAVKHHDARLREQMLEALKSIPLVAFEALIGTLLERLGYEAVEVRGRSGDGGVVRELRGAPGLQASGSAGYACGFRGFSYTRSDPIRTPVPIHSEQRSGVFVHPGEWRSDAVR